MNKAKNFSTRFIAACVALGSIAVVVTPALAESATADGRIKKIDLAASKVTITHGPIKSMQMDEGMTMVYRVKNPDILKSVKVGESVKFDLDHDSSGYTVTKIDKK